MGLRMVDLVLTLLAQDITYLRQDRTNNGIEEVMALHIEIGCLRGDTSCQDVVLHLQVGFLVIGELALQFANLRSHLTPDIRD